MWKFIHVRKVVKNIAKSFGENKVLTDVSFVLNKGSITVLMGTNGSGKTTLFNIISGFLPPDYGEVLLGGEKIVHTTDYEINRLGITRTFQDMRLISNLTVKENIQVCEYLTKNPLNMDELLKTLGMTEHQNKFPSQLSGGQQQRCAIARALIKNPKLLLCDEPTGALDYKTGKLILRVLYDINKNTNKTIVVITHNAAIAAMADRVIRVRSGAVESITVNETPESPERIEW